MPCTTILVGKKASYDGSTMIARNDDSGAGHYTPKKFVVVQPEDQPRHYVSVLSHVEIELPDNPMRYTAVPNAIKGKGTWAASGVNAAGVAMTATETISSNERVLGADPLVEYIPAEENGGVEVPGGIGEEDLVVLVLPYIHSAREGVQRMGALLEQYGTYEMNGMAFQDTDEIWWLETIGGHHWMARRVPDEVYVMMPNQLGLDELDLADALGEQEEFMCSADLKEFIEENHLDLTLRLDCCCGRDEEEEDAEDEEMTWGERLKDSLNQEAASFTEKAQNLRAAIDAILEEERGTELRGQIDAAWENELGEYNDENADEYSDEYEEESDDEEEGCCGCRNRLNPREAFGSHDDADHVYNTPRAWYIGRYFNPRSIRWDGPDADFTPLSDDIPWCLVPERKVTVEDVKYVLSSHYQGTPYDPYASYGDPSMRGAYRSIGVNRTDFVAIIQLRGDVPEDYQAVEWLAFGSNAFNTAVPFYANVETTPEYLSNTTKEVSTENFYWSARLIEALTDANYGKNLNHIEHYQLAVQSKGHNLIGKYDRLQAAETDPAVRAELREKANEEIAAMLRKETGKALDEVLFDATNHMKNQYARSDH